MSGSFRRNNRYLHRISRGRGGPVGAQLAPTCIRRLVETQALDSRAIRLSFRESRPARQTAGRAQRIRFHQLTVHHHDLRVAKVADGFRWVSLH
jgi:hypothetical protein